MTRVFAVALLFVAVANAFQGPMLKSSRIGEYAHARCARCGIRQPQVAAASMR